MFRRLFGLVLVVILSTLVLGACGQPKATPTVTPKPTPGGAANMPNPASVYCQQQGYKVEVRTASDGSQYGVCIFPDGSECDEWAFFRGECGQDRATPGTGLNMANPASVYCQQQGYQVEIRTASDGSQYGVCIFPDRSECDEWAFFRGECGQDKVTPTP